MTANDVKPLWNTFPDLMPPPVHTTGTISCEVIDDYTVYRNKKYQSSPLLHTFPAVSDIVPTEFVENPALWRDQWIVPVHGFSEI